MTTLKSSPRNGKQGPAASLRLHLFPIEDCRGGQKVHIVVAVNVGGQHISTELSSQVSWKPDNCGKRDKKCKSHLYREQTYLLHILWLKAFLGPWSQQNTFQKAWFINKMKVLTLLAALYLCLVLTHCHFGSWTQKRVTFQTWDIWSERQKEGQNNIKW